MAYIVKETQRNDNNEIQWETIEWEWYCCSLKKYELPPTNWFNKTRVSSSHCVVFETRRAPIFEIPQTGLHKTGCADVIMLKIYVLYGYYKKIRCFILPFVPHCQLTFQHNIQQHVTWVSYFHGNIEKMKWTKRRKSFAYYFPLLAALQQIPYNIM